MTLLLALQIAQQVGELLLVDGLLDALLFAGNGQMVKHVMVGGKWIVRDGRHPDEAAIAARYRQVQKQLYAAL